LVPAPFHRESLDLLGVHTFGENAAERLHIRRAVLLRKGKITYFMDKVFNDPTLA
jgi:NAD(P) transhydrogenase